MYGGLGLPHGGLGLPHGGLGLPHGGLDLVLVHLLYLGRVLLQHKVTLQLKQN